MMQDIVLVSGDALFTRMLSIELRVLRRNIVILESLTAEEMETLYPKSACALLLLDLDVPYVQLERLLNFTEEQEIPVILFGHPDSEAMTPDKMRFYDSDIYRYVFPRPFLIHQFLYCAKELLHTEAEPEELPTEPPAMKMKQHSAADDIRINEQARQVYYKNDLIVLTRTEFDVLLYLMQRRGTVVTRAELAEAAAPPHKRDRTTRDSNVIDVYIRFLRQKLDVPYRVKLIETVRGVGYIIRKES